jgi:hypothetical protein
MSAAATGAGAPRRKSRSPGRSRPIGGARIGCTATDGEGERSRINAVTDHAGDMPRLHLTRIRDQQPETWTCDGPAARGLRMEEGPCA